MSQVKDITLDEAYTEEKVEETEIVTEEVAAEEEVEVKTETEETAKAAEGGTTAPKKDEWTLTAVMDEREKRQTFQKENEELKQKLAEFEKLKDEVSIFTDEDVWNKEQGEKVDSKVNEAVLGMSRAYAVREFGEEKVAAAEKWYAEEGMKSPHAIDRIHKSSLKFHEAVGLYEEEQTRLDPESYKAKLKAEILEELKQEEPSEDKPKSITPSLASARSAGAEKESPDDWDDILG